MNDPNGNPRRSRLEDEVLEILAKTDRKPPLTAKARAWGRTARAQILKWRAHIGWLDTAWGWFGIALALFIIGGWVAKDSGLLQQVIQIAGIVAIAVAVLRLVRPGPGQGRKMWRGRPMDLKKPGVELGDNKLDDWRKRR
jgi:hypothetical protein